MTWVNEASIVLLLLHWSTNIQVSAFVPGLIGNAAKPVKHSSGTAYDRSLLTLSQSLPTEDFGSLGSSSRRRNSYTGNINVNLSNPRRSSIAASASNTHKNRSRDPALYSNNGSFMHFATRIDSATALDSMKQDSSAPIAESPSPSISTEDTSQELYLEETEAQMIAVSERKRKMREMGFFEPDEAERYTEADSVQSLINASKLPSSYASTQDHGRDKVRKIRVKMSEKDTLSEIKKNNFQAALNKIKNNDFKRTSLDGSSVSESTISKREKKLKTIQIKLRRDDPLTRMIKKTINPDDLEMQSPSHPVPQKRIHSFLDIEGAPTVHTASLTSNSWADLLRNNAVSEKDMTEPNNESAAMFQHIFIPSFDIMKENEHTSSTFQPVPPQNPVILDTPVKIDTTDSTTSIDQKLAQLDQFLFRWTRGSEAFTPASPPPKQQLSLNAELKARASQLESIANMAKKTVADSFEQAGATLHQGLTTHTKNLNLVEANQVKEEFERYTTAAHMTVTAQAVNLESMARSVSDSVQDATRKLSQGMISKGSYTQIARTEVRRVQNVFFNFWDQGSQADQAQGTDMKSAPRRSASVADSTQQTANSLNHKQTRLERVLNKDQVTEGLYRFGILQKESAKSSGDTHQPVDVVAKMVPKKNGNKNKIVSPQKAAHEIDEAVQAKAMAEDRARYLKNSHLASTDEPVAPMSTIQGATAIAAGGFMVMAGGTDAMLVATLAGTVGAVASISRGQLGEAVRTAGDFLGDLGELAASVVTLSRVVAECSTETTIRGTSKKREVKPPKKPRAEIKKNALARALLEHRFQSETKRCTRRTGAETKLNTQKGTRLPTENLRMATRIKDSEEAAKRRRIMEYRMQLEAKGRINKIDDDSSQSSIMEWSTARLPAEANQLSDASASGAEKRLLDARSKDSMEADKSRRVMEHRFQIDENVKQGVYGHSSTIKGTEDLLSVARTRDSRNAANCRLLMNFRFKLEAAERMKRKKDVAARALFTAKLDIELRERTRQMEEQRIQLEEEERLAAIKKVEEKKRKEKALLAKVKKAELDRVSRLQKEIRRSNSSRQEIKREIQRNHVAPLEETSDLEKGRLAWEAQLAEEARIIEGRRVEEERRQQEQARLLAKVRQDEIDRMASLHEQVRQKYVSEKGSPGGKGDGNDGGDDSDEDEEWRTTSQLQMVAEGLSKRSGRVGILSRLRRKPNLLRLKKNIVQRLAVFLSLPAVLRRRKDY